jgi:acyl dehydratase
MSLRREDLEVGQTYEERIVDDLKRTQIVMYAGASGDFHPFHSDEPYAKAMGMPGIFAHGMLSMGMTGRALTNFVGDGTLTAYSARFRGQVWPGDTLTTRITVEAIRDQEDPPLVDVAISTVNQNGEEVLAGSATAKLEA